MAKRKAPLSMLVNTSTPFRGGILTVTQSIPAAPWAADLSTRQLEEQRDIARREFDRLRTVLESDNRWVEWRDAGRAQFRWILEAALHAGRPWFLLLAWSAPRAAAKRSAAEAFSAILDTVYRRAYPVYAQGGFTAARPICPFVAPRVDAWRALALDVLSAVNEPRDEWHQSVALALLLSPDLASETLTLGFWLAPPPRGQGDVERQHSAMVGAPFSTEQAGVKAKRALRRELGYVAPRSRPGPTPGRSYQPRPERLEFETFVRKKSEQGLIAKQIACDPEAQRLYRAIPSQRDPEDRQLSRAIVQRVLRRAKTPAG